MSLADAAFCLDELAAGRVPDMEQALQGLLSLDPLILGAKCEHALMDAAATLELLVATGGTVDLFTSGRTRAIEMAAAVRRAMGPG